MKERRRRERERLINLSTCGCVIQLYLWENTQFIKIREFGWGFFNADVIINIPPAFFSLQKSGLVGVSLPSVFLLLSVPRCFGDPKPQFDSLCSASSSFFCISSIWFALPCLNEKK